MAAEHPSNCQGPPSLHLRLHRGDLERKCKDVLDRLETEWSRKWERWLHQKSKQMHDDIREAFDAVDKSTLPYIVELKEARVTLTQARDETIKGFEHINKEHKLLAKELRTSTAELPKQVRNDIQEAFNLVDHKLQPCVLELREATDTLHHAREETRNFFKELQKQHKKQLVAFENSMSELRELKSDFTVVEATHHLNNLTAKAKSFCEAMDDARESCKGVDKAKHFTDFVGDLHADLQAASGGVKELALLGETLRDKVAASCTTMNELNENIDATGRDAQQLQKKGEQLKRNFENIEHVADDLRQIKDASTYYLKSIERFQKGGEDEDLLRSVYKESNLLHKQLHNLTDIGGKFDDFSKMLDALVRGLGDDPASTAHSVREQLSSLKRNCEDYDKIMTAAQHAMSGDDGLKPTMIRLKGQMSDASKVMDDSATQTLFENLKAIGPKATAIRDVTVRLEEIQKKSDSLQDTFKDADRVTKVYVDMLSQRHRQVEKSTETFEEFYSGEDGGLACLKKLSKHARDTVKNFEVIQSLSFDVQSLGKIDLKAKSECFAESLKEAEQSCKTAVQQVNKNTVSISQCNEAFDKFLEQNSGDQTALNKISKQASETLKRLSLVSDLLSEVEGLGKLNFAEQVKAADSNLKHLSQSLISQSYWDKLSEEIQKKVASTTVETAERTNKEFQSTLQKFEDVKKHQLSLLDTMKGSEETWGQASEICKAEFSKLVKRMEEQMEHSQTTTQGAVKLIIENHVGMPLKSLMDQVEQASKSIKKAESSLKAADDEAKQQLVDSKVALDAVKEDVIQPLAELGKKAESLKKFTIGGFGATLASVLGSLPLVISMMPGGNADTGAGNQTAAP